MTQAPRGSARFLTTRWSVVLAARSAAEPLRRVALEELCAAYWYPLYAFARRSGFDADAAADLTQDFFAQLLSRTDLQRADRERGRFRTYMLAALRHMIVNHREARRTLKRGGGTAQLSIDAHDAETRFGREPVDARTPELAFERAWAEAVIARAFERLREEQARIGREPLFDALRPALLAADDAPPYAEVAARFSVTENSVKVAVHRLRRRLGELLRDEVGATLERPEEVEAEIAELFAAFSTPPVR
ncbi:MAG: sigma-70 family RNA polymerase sigma factor [Planctomycetes bacterium]|nr:sigma-70 family RNA polymerase sigma factor [Planctomycetota bacterium]